MMLTFHCTATDLWKKKRIPPGAGNVWCLPLWGSALTFHGCPNRQKKILAHTFAARTELFKSMAHVIMMNIIPPLHVFFRVSRMLHLSFVQWEVKSTSTVSKVLVDYCYLFLFFFYQSMLPSLSLPQFFLWRHQLDGCWWTKVIKWWDVCVRASGSTYMYVSFRVCVCMHPTAISTILYSHCNGGRRQLMRACVLIWYLATLTVPARRPRQQLLLPVIDCSATGEERRDITLNHWPATLLK